MTLKLTTTLCLMVTALLTACSDSDNEPLANPENQTSAPAPGVDPNDGPQALTQYNGSYVKNCSPDDPDPHYTLELSVSDDVWNSVRTQFSDADCITTLSTTEISYSVVYPGGSTDTDRGPADHVDVTIELSQVNGETVTDEGNGQAEYSLILLDGNDLYAGQLDEENDGSTAEKRAAILEDESIASRQ